MFAILELCISVFILSISHEDGETRGINLGEGKVQVGYASGYDLNGCNADAETIIGV